MKRREFLDRARDKHGYKYNYIGLSDKLTLTDKIEIEYKGEIYLQSISKHLLGRCPEKAVKKKTTDDFIIEAKIIWGDKYDYSLVEYTGALNNIKIIYNGIVYEQRASSHLLGLSPEFRNNEESLLRDKIYQSDIIGINEIREFLIKYQISFEENKNLDNLIFHFYLPKNRMVVEYLSNKHSLVKELDKIKEEYCEDNYINLLRISHKQIDDIYTILYENLKTYINR